MKQFFLMTALLLAGSALAAPPIVGDARLADTWEVFLPVSKNREPLPAEALKKIPEQLYGLKSRSFRLENGSFDLSQFFGYAKANQCAWIFGSLETQQAGDITIGAGADWWMRLYVDGREVINTYPDGNDLFPPHFTNIRKTFNLGAGQHTIAIFFESGRASSTFSFAGPRELRAYYQAAPTPQVDAGQDLIGLLKNTRPRLFLTPDLIANIKQNMTPEQKEYLAALRKRCDQLPLQPELKPFTNAWGSVNDHGLNASAAALVWLLTDEQVYFDKALSWLDWSVKWYNQRYDEKKAISWYSYTRIGALSAYDWLYEQMPAVKRHELGLGLLRHLKQATDTKEIHSYHGEGSSGPANGFYGTTNLFWFGGIVFHKAGLDDALAVELLTRGYQDYQTMFKLRADIAGISGGPRTISPGYAIGDYWKQEFNFFYSYKAATGLDFVDKYPELAKLPEWILRTSFPDSDGKRQEYGAGDNAHHKNIMPLPPGYLAQYQHFYRELSPVNILIANYLLGKVIRNRSAIYNSFNNRHDLVYYPFMFTLPNIDFQTAENFLESLPASKHYPSLGQTFMNSGWQYGDTSALFLAGASVGGHKHRDEGHFTIYKKGFQAIDSGARLIYSGMKIDDNYRQNCAHNANYFYRTVAHNCLLIHQPDESFGSHTFPGKVKTMRNNDGGMQRSLGGIVLAYENQLPYTYIVADLTKVYNETKAQRVIRHFLYIQPDYFVVYDLVETVQPDYKTTWLLHLLNEPKLTGQTMYAKENQGAIQAQSLLPVKAELKLIGGNGNEFVSGGQNYPIAPPDTQSWEKNNFLYGKWRLEISPSTPQASNRFLNFLQVADADEKALPEARLLAGDVPAIAFRTRAGQDIRVEFKADGTPGGTFQIDANTFTLAEVMWPNLSPDEEEKLIQKARAIMAQPQE